MELEGGDFLGVGVLAPILLGLLVEEGGPLGLAWVGNPFAAAQCFVVKVPLRGRQAMFRILVGVVMAITQALVMVRVA